jgi:hypothetical protein
MRNHTIIWDTVLVPKPKGLGSLNRVNKKANSLSSTKSVLSNLVLYFCSALGIFAIVFAIVEIFYEGNHS